MIYILSKKLKNSILTNIPADNPNKKEIENELNAVSCEIPDNSIDKVNGILSAFFLAFLGKNSGIIDYNSDSLSDFIEEIIRTIAHEKSFSTIVFSIGMGGSITPPSIRLPAYIIPALNILNLYLENLNIEYKEYVPKIRVFQAVNIATHVNKYDKNLVTKNSNVTFSFLRSFVGEFYTELQDYIFFEEDTSWIKNTNNIWLLEKIKNISQELNSNSEIQLEVQSIKDMGNKHGGKEGQESSTFYAVLHPLYNYAISTKKDSSFLFSKTNSNDYTAIIDIGGRPQITFNTISLALRKALPSNEFTTLPLLHLIHRAGKIPVYYNARNGDINIGDDLTNFNLNDMDFITHQDYKIIFDIVPDYEYLGFIDQFTNKT